MMPFHPVPDRHSTAVALCLSITPLGSAPGGRHRPIEDDGSVDRLSWRYACRDCHLSTPITGAEPELVVDRHQWRV